MSCYHCGATTDNGLALCEQCRAGTSVYLEFLPVYFSNLARWRPGRAGSRPVPGSREPKDFRPREGDAVERALDDAGNVLISWARNLEDDRGGQAPAADGETATVAALCRWFSERLTTIATLEWCGEFVRELGEYEATLRALTERVAPGWYAGACGLCEAPTYVVPGLTWVTCAGCGRTTYARDHLDTILDEAREWVATPIKLAEFIVAIRKDEHSVPDLRKRIAVWGNRDHYECVRDSEYAVKRYRLGDVLDRLDRDSRQAAA